ncbi:MAG: cell division protein FtsZ [Acetobacteraceae bacterium]|nr:cell division protein FtsZ [Acetobacteraceae bacterium]
MTLNLNAPQQMHTDFTPRITVIGVGGGGTNAVDNMILANLRGVDFVVANTDAQQLMHSKADRRVQLGPHLTQGLGAGAKPDIGRAAAEEAADELYRHLDGTHMVFITAGMGGGTGTGAAPVIARMAKERGILTVGVVTRPFGFEGSRRARAADEGILELQQYVDTLIVIPNQNLFNIASERTTWREAFKMADQVLYMGVRGVTDLMMVHGQINLDFADIKTVMAEMGKAMMGTGEAEGEDRAKRAAEAAINNPLLEETSMAGARGLLINITGGDDLTLFEVDQAVSTVRDQVDEEANVLFGSATDESLQGRIRVSVVATGIDQPREYEMPRPKLVAVGGGAIFAEPRPIPLPVSNPTLLQGQMAEPVAMGVTASMGLQQQASNITALRQQPERVIIPDPMPYPDELTTDQQRRPISASIPAPRQPSRLFSHTPAVVEATPAPQPSESVARSLFQQATGLFRKRTTATPVPETAARRREPTAEMPAQAAPATELAVEPDRAGDRRSGVADDSGIEIPAFLRRQSSSP